MPSACTKPDKGASTDAADAIKNAVLVVDKKIRNLEKRKGKLDAYRAKYAEGEELNKDQQDAISKYESVMATLEFAHDLHKQFMQLQAEAEKLLRKQSKRDKLDKQAHEIRCMNELLQLQNLLDSMGADQVRSDFEKGENGAVKLSEDNLTQLDELYKLISPTREADTTFAQYTEQMTAAAEHIVSFLDAKEKEVAGTTYKDLKELVEKIYESGYFEKAPVAEEEQETEPAEAETTEQVEFSAEPEVEPEEPEEAQVSGFEQEVPQGLATHTAPQVPEFDSLEPEPIAQLVESPVQAPPTQPMGNQSDPENYEQPDAPSFFSTDPVQPRHRGFQEIVSSVQGSFNFLQDSQIELDYSASLAAQQAYQASGLLGSEDQRVQFQGQLISDQAQPHADTALSSMVSDASQQQYHDQPTPQPTQTHTGSLDSYSPEQSYGQNLMSQNLSTSSTFADQSTTFASQMASQAALEQAVGISTSTNEVPQPIPLPSQTLPGQSLTSQHYGSSSNTQSAYSPADATQTGFGSSDTSQITFGSSDTSQISFGAADASQSSFGSAPTTQYGSSTTSQTSYGSTSTSQPGYGSSGAPAGYGSSNMPHTAYSSSSTSQSNYGSSNSTQPGYGPSSTSQTGYGSTNTSQPGYGSRNTSQTAFGSSNASQTGYGSAGASQTGYGSTNTSQTGYGSSGTSQSGYGSSSTSQSGYGSGSTSQTGYGATDSQSHSQSTFGATDSAPSGFGTSDSPQTFGSSPAGYGASDTSQSGFDGSDSPQTGFGASDSSQSAYGGPDADKQEKKSYSMNPNAEVFSSRYSQPSFPFGGEQGTMSHAGSSGSMGGSNNTMANSMPGQDTKTYSSSMGSNDYGNSNYGGGNRWSQSGSGPPRGARGNSRGQRGSSGNYGNGYNRGQRGSGGGNSYGSSRGYSNGTRGSRGGGGGGGGGIRGSAPRGSGGMRGGGGGARGGYNRSNSGPYQSPTQSGQV